MSRLAWRGLFIALITVGLFAVLFPTFQYFSMSPAARAAMPPEKLDSLRDRALNLGLDLQGGAHLVYEANMDKLPADQRVDAVDRAVEIIRNRIDQLGVGEHVVQKQGTDRILVQLPGVLDTERAKDIVGKTARLEFKLVRTDTEVQSVVNRLDAFLAARAGNDTTGADTLGASQQPFSSLVRTAFPGALFFDVNDIPAVDRMLETARTAIPANTGLAWSREITNPTGTDGKYLWILDNRVDLSGGHIQNAEYAVGVDNTNPSAPGVRLIMTKEGGAIFYRLTRANVNRNLAIVLDNSVYSAPRILDAIKGGEAVITGITLDEEARDLSVVLRAGALPADISIVEERTVGPSLGRDSIRQGVAAGLVGASAVILFMLIYYQASGIIAVLVLVLNIAYLFAALVLIDATLTLPGLAGIVLTVGMAVDANILIFERIREELAAGRSVRGAIDMGYKRAFVTILDSNLTTMMTALALLIFSSGPVKGFGLTLTIGIALNLFTAVFVSRVLYDTISSRWNLKRLSI
jgi:SecD/SecF fusion protein